MDDVSEERLQAGEASKASHHHEGVDMTEESLGDHLASNHGVAVPARLSFGALRGIHDRFHGEAHAADD